MDDMINLVRNKIDLNSMFPDNVFSDRSGHFAFIEADAVTSQDGLEIIKFLLKLDGCKEFYFINIDNYLEGDLENCFKIFSVNVPYQEYYTEWLKGGGATGWIFSVPRVACASMSGKWIMYGELQNELAAFCFFDDLVAEKLIGETKFSIVLPKDIKSSGNFFSAFTSEWNEKMEISYADLI